MALYHALIRTHHMTSRSKIAAIRDASLRLSVNAVLRTGAFPGIMYVSGDSSRVDEWLRTVKRLRYKDYQLVVKPAPCPPGRGAALRAGDRAATLEVERTSDFAEIMEQRGLLQWWKRGMGFR